MNRTNAFFCSLFIAGPVLLFCAHTYAQPISSTDLINRAAQFDNTRISYEGEAIGDIMYRGNFAWINIHDGANAIGVWAEGSIAKVIQRTGNYCSKGDWVEVTGVFHRACPAHGGDLDIHAESIRIVKPGRAYPEKLNLSKRTFALVLLGILGAVWILKQLRAK